MPGGTRIANHVIHSPTRYPLDHNTNVKIIRFIVLFFIKLKVTVDQWIVCILLLCNVVDLHPFE